MAKYRKKPVVIEAVQLKAADVNNSLEVDGFLFEESPQWLLFAIEKGKIKVTREPESDYAHLIIKTMEGDHLARPGDFIIRGVHGEIYPCNPEIFEKTYEAA